MSTAASPSDVSALSYCSQAGVDTASLLAELSPAEAEAAVHTHLTALRAHVDTHAAAWLSGDAEALFTYRVPLLGEGGSCSLFGQLNPTPYDLRGIFALSKGGASAPPHVASETSAGQQGQEQQQQHAEKDDGRRAKVALLLARTQCLVEAAQASTAVDWIGIYKRCTRADGGAVLVKLAYRGSPSRAEFPLTEAFAQHSNNSRVGLSGRGRIIQDVPAYVAAGGEYYTCDPSVNAEACLPLLGAGGEVVGIVDAETARAGFFTPEVLARVLAFTLAAQQLLRECGV